MKEGSPAERGPRNRAFQRAPVLIVRPRPPVWISESISLRWMPISFSILSSSRRSAAAAMRRLRQAL